MDRHKIDSFLNVFVINLEKNQGMSPKNSISRFKRIPDV